MVSDLVWLTGSSGFSPLPVPTHAWGKPYRDKEQEQCHESAATCFQKIFKKLFTVLHDDSLSVDRYLSSMKPHTVCLSTSGVGVAHSAAVSRRGLSALAFESFCQYIKEEFKGSPRCRPFLQGQPTRVCDSGGQDESLNATL